MASIPLLCNICPKEPDFSDISHLLTHIASKGHLAHLFKAQIRARQEPATRQKLDVYDQWKSQYHIDKLLSERMTLKQSKGTRERNLKSNVKDSTPARSAKPIKPRKPRIKDSPDLQQHPSPVKSEDYIDPQLSHSLLATSFDPSRPTYHQTQHDPAVEHRAHVPRMSTWQGESPLQHGNTESVSPRRVRVQHRSDGPDVDTDCESDYFRNFIRSPTAAAYPDPSEITGLRSDICSPTLETHGNPIESSRTNSGRCSELVEASPDLSDSGGLRLEKGPLIQSPILKGVKWPGMSLFDSANREAQRRRNQRKDGSILEQMEYNSIVVEQIERIFWPDGTLKKKRLITGNVESSPIHEPTPPPKPSRRRRTNIGTRALKDKSTNQIKAQDRKTRPSQKRDSPTSANMVGFRDLSSSLPAKIGHPKMVHPQDVHIRHYQLDEGLSGQALSREVPHSKRSKPAFEVFHDDDADTRLKSSHSHGVATQSCGTIIQSQQSCLGICDRKQPHGLPYDARFRQDTAADEKENIEPVLDENGRVEDFARPKTERVTQRYFSLTGSHAPQFFSSLPPHMDFGGLAEPGYYGATLNPLNPYLRQQLVHPQYPSEHARLSTPAMPSRQQSISNHHDR